MASYNVKWKGFFGGSGSDLMNHSSACEAVINLVGKNASAITLLYIGTATYDLPMPRQRQTGKFAAAGCKVTSLECTSTVPENMEQLVAAADIILISGGNTLFATDCWRKIGLVPMLRNAMDRGCVLTGGSAGFIVWFDGGHSDSADPDSFKTAMELEASAVAAAGDSGNSEHADESSGAPANESEKKEWTYMRAPCLSFLPGLACPHHDRVQSNGVLRATDFDRMLLRHQGERGICIDHWAALVVNHNEYEVFSLRGEGRGGSVQVGDGNREPGVLVKDVVEGRVVVTPVPSKGTLSDLLRPATVVVEDPCVDACRVANPLCVKA
eukprot:TRINITY_DN12621_c0_g1_i1.p1 TRINITY_DN12621_c0_g1~~TRINITY_DN12621_c0_g1_i1.p1  ORF type:complete len:326 (+),score=40.12 TRINITY_DN12621_c0_g1_i1:195-1172(+)